MKDNKQKNWFKKHKILTVIGVLMVIGIIGAATSNNKTPSTAASTTNTSSNSNSSSSSTASSTIPKINQQANDGKFGFTVTAFQCGVTQIIQSDNQYEVASPQGQYCEMSLTVKNISTVSQTFDDSSQYIYDSSNKQYSDDSNGTIAANPSSSQFMDLPTVNPGVSISGVLAFDIPKGVTPTYAMLHDSSASDGVKVSLAQ